MVTDAAAARRYRHCGRYYGGRVRVRPAPPAAAGLMRYRPRTELFAG